MDTAMDTAMDLFFLLVVNEIQPHSAKLVDNKNNLIKSIVPQKLVPVGKTLPYSVI